ncbi:MAG: alpha/beta hydrolase [Synergistaceae bacterium]|nr:alpha/beta hydrolase [Synergistaceae bacterium]MBQ6972417.1 alpha/beta hydrolase [Synergistaceae bacterium]
MRKILLALFVMALLSSFAFADEGQKFESKILNVPLEKNQVMLYENIPFNSGKERGSQMFTLAMDILQPDSKEPLPLIMFISGGGFIMSPKNNWIQQRMRLAEAGYVVASIEYRHAPLSKFPLPVEDCKLAIRWLRAHADQYNIDPERVGVLGNSAGGYLSAFMGVLNDNREFDKGDFLDQSSNILCAVDIFGISELMSIGDDYPEEERRLHDSPGITEAMWVKGVPGFGGPDGGVKDFPEESRRASPLYYVSDKTVPMLFMHGDADKSVSPSQTDKMYQALRAQGIEAERYVVPGAPHGGAFWMQEPVLKIIVDFFDKYMKK